MSCHVLHSYYEINNNNNNYPRTIECTCIIIMIQLFYNSSLSCELRSGTSTVMTVVCLVSGD